MFYKWRCRRTIGFFVELATDVLITGGATVAPHMNTFVYDQLSIKLELIWMEY